MNSQQSDKKITKQVRVDIGLHQLLKIVAAKRSMSIRSLLEEYVASGLNGDNYLKI